VSTILKALRRLEEEKRAGGERPLREEVAAAGAAADASRRPGRLSLLLGGAVVLCLAAVVWSQWPFGEDAGASDVAAQPTAVASLPAPERRPAAAPRTDRPTAPTAVPARPAPPRADAQDRAGLPERAFTSDVKVVPRPPVEPRKPIDLARASEPTPEASAKTPAPEPAPVAKTPAPEPAVAAKTPAPEPAPVVAKTPAPEPAVVVAKTPPADPAPAVAKAPPTAASPTPAQPEAAAEAADLFVERTLWHPVPSRRAAFVALDGGPATRVEEGDVVGRYVVSEIRASGVVFLRDGKPLERKVGAR
jgi:hypothetical protein